MRFAVLFAALAAAPAPLSAQTMVPGEASTTGNLSATQFGPWLKTTTTDIDVRARCDGDGPLGGPPMKWTLQFQNRARTTASFEFAVLYRPGPFADSINVARITVKAGGIRGKAVVVRTRDCADPIAVKMIGVRFEENRD